MKEQELKDALNMIEISEKSRGRILEKSKTVSYRKGNGHMKSKKKFAIIAVAATFILGITAFAVNNKITLMYSTSSAIPEYTELPRVQQVIDDVGYAGDMIEEFPNGYSFDEGSVRKNAIKSDSDTIEEFKSLSLWYVKGANKVILSIDKYSSDMQNEDNGAKLLSRNGDIDIYEHSFINKIVPEGYVKSEEELAAEERGELYFAQDGEDHIVETNIKSVSWTKGDIRYNLMQMDGELSTDELVVMANELIEQD